MIIVDCQSKTTKVRFSNILLYLYIAIFEYFDIIESWKIYQKYLMHFQIQLD